MKALTLDSAYEKYSFGFALAACLLLPLKLSFAYFCLVPVLLLWLGHIRLKFWNSLRTDSSLILPYAFFVLVALVSLPFGFDPLRSLNKLLGVAFFGLTLLAFRDICLVDTKRCERLLITLVGGQTLAALYSVIEGAFGPAIPRILIGAVSESGQLAQTVLVAGGFLILYSRSPLDNSGPGAVRRKVDSLLGLVNFCAFTALALASASQVRSSVFAVELLLASLLLFVSLARLKRFWKYDSQFSDHCANFLKTIALPLLMAALIVNLKRGPWMGVLVAALILLWLERRVLAVPVLLVAGLLLGTVKPVQQRLLSSEEHFFIVGGRSEIWDIGVELAKRFPMGVGYRNSNSLQKFSELVPPNLTHFHNNILNVLVETGWLGLAVYLWWILSILKAAFAKVSVRRDRILRESLGCAILSWQIAGLVEYNFGDSEVVLVALILTGILAAIVAKPTAAIS
ncbi:MAG: O-antigen ligase family protein [Deltaproteobacteria bacterium]|nr:O-antigen ligase family protein [Deltaproteobacteria bacterium]